MLLYQRFFEGVVMVIKPAVSLETSEYSSIEEVQNLWRERISEEWVEAILTSPDTEQHVYSLAAKLDLSLPDAWSTYFAGLVASQM
jgi:hypothetical protein